MDQEKEKEKEARGTAMENLAQVEALIRQNLSSSKWQMEDVTQAFYLSHFDQFGNVLLSGKPCLRAIELVPSQGGGTSRVSLLHVRLPFLSNLAHSMGRRSTISFPRFLF